MWSNLLRTNISHRFLVEYSGGAPFYLSWTAASDMASGAIYYYTNCALCPRFNENGYSVGTFFLKRIKIRVWEIAGRFGSMRKLRGIFWEESDWCGSEPKPKHLVIYCHNTWTKLSKHIIIKLTMILSDFCDKHSV